MYGVSLVLLLVGTIVRSRDGTLTPEPSEEPSSQTKQCSSFNLHFRREDTVISGIAGDETITLMLYTTSQPIQVSPDLVMNQGVVVAKVSHNQRWSTQLDFFCDSNCTFYLMGYSVERECVSRIYELQSAPISSYPTPSLDVALTEDSEKRIRLFVHPPCSGSFFLKETSLCDSKSLYHSLNSVESADFSLSTFVDAAALQHTGICVGVQCGLQSLEPVHLTAANLTSFSRQKTYSSLYDHFDTTMRISAKLYHSQTFLESSAQNMAKPSKGKRGFCNVATVPLTIEKLSGFGNVLFLSLHCLERVQVYYFVIPVGYSTQTISEKMVVDSGVYAGTFDREMVTIALRDFYPYVKNMLYMVAVTKDCMTKVIRRKFFV